MYNPEINYEKMNFWEIFQKISKDSLKQLFIRTMWLDKKLKYDWNGASKKNNEATVDDELIK